MVVDKKPKQPVYMIRRKFYIPDDERNRDYRDGHESYVYNYLFDSDFEEVEDKDG